MLEECVHILPDGRTCRRIPKRGQKLCPAHRPHRRRRAPLEENQAFLKEMAAFVRSLEAMESDDLLYSTVGFLADIQILIDRRSSRRDRFAFGRASAAAATAADRLVELARGLRQPSASQPQPQPPAPPSSQPLSPEARARLQHLEALTNSGRTLTPEELSYVCEEMLNTLNSHTKTLSTLSSNT